MVLTDKWLRVLQVITTEDRELREEAVHHQEAAHSQEVHRGGADLPRPLQADHQEVLLQGMILKMTDPKEC